jgi:hypothetical protein
MAGRIKYRHINSGKGRTQERSESNNKQDSPLFESNSTASTQFRESNSTINTESQSNISKLIKKDGWLSDPLGRILETNEEDDDQATLPGFGSASSDQNQADGSHDEINEELSGSSGGKSPKTDDEDQEKSEEPTTGSDDSSESNSSSDMTYDPEKDGLSKIPEVDHLPTPVTREEITQAQLPSKMVDGPLRGVPYYRTSPHDEQNDSTNPSITKDQQKPMVEGAFRAFSIEQVHEPIEDQAVSGEEFDREGLEEIEELAEAGKINVVVVSDIDRIGRVCEKTIEFVKRLREEYDVYVIANFQFYDVSQGDDLETFNAKAGRAEANNKKRSGRGNRAKLFKLVDNGSDAYQSWFQTIPVGYEEGDTEHGIRIASDQTREIPKLVVEEFLDLSVESGEYAETGRRVRERLREEFDYEYEGELNIKDILTDPIYTGRALLKIRRPHTHRVDKAEIVVKMSDLQLFNEEYTEMWEEAQEKVDRLEQKYRDKKEAHPETLLARFGPEMVDEEVAEWTLVCPECGSTSEYVYYGTTRDTDGTKRQKCKCTGGNEDVHYFRVPTREEFEALLSSDDEGDNKEITGKTEQEVNKETGEDE